MTLKQFLKPDWRKIVIFVILFLFWLFIILFTSCFHPRITCEEGYESYYETLIIVCSSRCISENLIILYRIRDFTLGIFVYFILPYLISCLIVWIYDKFRK